ncbi:hypothetical protein FQN57_005093 [Myotisia sp. PD_48]|nr:hypothetical protein FQN57_005093 [Myotisia sp. PD_48]
MPSLASYTPFESLLFFQSLAALNSRPSSFAHVSELLKNNPFIRQDVAFDAERLSPQALEDLYGTLLKEGIDSSDDEPGDGCQSRPNIGASPPNPKKRKRSQEVVQDGVSNAHASIVPTLVYQLYSRYKKRVTREIQQEEKKYTNIQEEIRRLENGPALEPQSSAGAQAGPSMDATSPVPPPAPTQPEVMPQKAAEKQPVANPKNNTPPGPPSAVGTPFPPRPNVAVGQTDEGSDEIFQDDVSLLPTPTVTAAAPISGEAWAPPPRVTTPLNQPLLSNKQPLQPLGQPASWTTPAGTNMLPHIQPSPINFNATTPTPSSKSNPRTPQILRPSITPYPSAPPMGIPGNKVRPLASAPDKFVPTQPPPKTVPQVVKFQPLLTPSTIPQSAYGHTSPHSSSQKSNRQPRGKSIQAQQKLVSPSAGGPVQNPQPLPAVSPIPPSTAGPTPTSITTPSRLNIDQQQNEQQQNKISGRETPKLITQFPSFAESLSRRTPRPSLATSVGNTPWKIPQPISLPEQPGSPIRPRMEDISPISDKANSPFESESPGYQGDRPKHAGRSRSRNITTRQPKKDGAGSPSPTTSTRRRTRRQSIASRTGDQSIKNELPSTPINIPDEEEIEIEAAQERSKRKRSPSQAYSLGNEAHATWTQDKQYVICPRTFTRTCAPIMNDVAAHKYASIFAKPLTNRDAPGYKDLIYRPQDIKSIKSAIHQGSRAVAAVTEAMNLPSTETGSTGNGTGVGVASKGNVLVAKKTAELMPPKGIVNSAQLEKELIRMFANAVMFNPTPDHTFGPTFPMGSDSTSRSDAGLTEPEEGGIINDTMEMYEDVEKAISTWRAAERTVDDAEAKNFLSHKAEEPS